MRIGLLSLYDNSNVEVQEHGVDALENVIKVIDQDKVPLIGLLSYAYAPTSHLAFYFICCVIIRSWPRTSDWFVVPSSRCPAVTVAARNRS